MKKLLFLIIFSILLISSVSAFEFDNVKSYDFINKEIMIKNSFLGIPTTQVASYKLTDNSDKCTTNCYAQGEADIKESGKLFSDTDFKDKFGKSRSLNYKIYYSTEKTPIEKSVPVYKNICTPIIENGKEIQDCRQNIIEKYEKQIDYDYNWQEYKGEELKEGFYYWRIEAKKGMYESIDWAVGMFGISTEEVREDWAWWTGITPNAYYHFENDLTDSSGFNNYLLAGAGSNNTFNSTSPFFGSYARQIVGQTAPDANLSSNLSFGTRNFTLGFWFKGTNTTDGRMMLTSGADNDGTEWQIVSNSGTLRFREQNALIIDIISMATITNGQWQRLIIVREGTGANKLKAYLNGTLVATGTESRNFVENSFSLGGTTSGDYLGMHGTYDELFVYNGFAFNSSDVTYDWNSSNGALLGSTPFVTSTLSQPNNNLATTNSTIRFFCNSTADSSISLGNVSLYVWNSSNAIVKSNTTQISGTTANNINWTNSFSDGVYKWNCQVNDTTNVYTDWADSNFTFTIDTTKPIVNITYPSSTTFTARNLTLNYTINDASSMTNCWFSLNGAANTTLSSCQNSTIYLNQRNNSVIVYANDTAGNVGNSSIVYPYYFPVLNQCNSSNNLAYVNFTFKNETTLQETVNASISSTFTYWFDNGVNRTLTYANTSAEWPSYSFCIDGGNNTLYTNPTLNYYNSYSPQRTYTNSMTLTNTTTNITLFLLPTSLGIYVSFQITDRANAPLVSATVNATNAGNLIETKLTDGAGIATIFLNPNQGYTICAAKTGYTTSCVSITPTQTQYTIQLSSTSATTTDYTRGIIYSIAPNVNSLTNNTAYHFNFTMNSTNWTLDSWGFRLYDSNNGQMNSTSNTSSYGILDVGLNTQSNRTIIMNAYWIVNGTTTNVTKTWIVYNSFETGWSILHFFNRLDSYTNSSGDSDGLFGLQRSSNNSFGYSLLIFLIIFTVAGILSYQFGLTSPAAIMTVIFGIVFFFDVVVGILPRPVAAPGIPAATVVTAIIMIAFLIKEAQR